ncbi:transposase [Burkholderiales bacterium JOSHI_001]|nr:transposase [Burkholderiales bacterium JOSHI_001]
MEQITRGLIVRVGVDLAKRVIQVHAVDAAGRVVVARALSREKFLSWCAQLQPGCIVAMETCSGAHHWARRLREIGVEPRLIAGHFVGPYRMEGRCGKNDANDAAAVCEAASRPHMRFVPIKTAEQQAVLAVHRLREGYKEERTGCINRIRGLLAEFGLVFPQSPQALRLQLADTLEDAANELPHLARVALQRAHLQWLELECHIAWCDERIATHVKADEQAQTVAQLMGIGPITASALVASVGDFRQFRTGAQFGAWLGLVPGQNSSGGKTSLGRITRRGDDYLRTLLIQGARSAVMSASKRTDRISQWLVQLTARVGWQKAVVAMANKNARILWAVLAKGRRFDADHCSLKPSWPPWPGRPGRLERKR